MRKKAMVFFFFPPPVGGIASINGMLKEGLEHTGEVLFVSAHGMHFPRAIRFLRPVANISKITINLLKLKRSGVVLFFSSAYTSFWEKLSWALLVSISGRKPIIVMVDGNFPRFYVGLSSFKKQLIKLVIYLQKGLIIGAQSEYWKEFYSSIFPNISVRTVTASVDSLFFDISHNKEGSKEKLQILYIGWIISDKGIYDLLDAIGMVNQTHADAATFRLVGPMFKKDELWESELFKRNIANNTVFTGPVLSRETILEEYRKADIFVFPSHYEGFPVALLEAIASGLPCIATEVGGVPDILDNGNAGIVVKPKSPEQLALAILKLLNDHSYRELLSKQAYERSRDSYSFNNFLISYKNILGLK